MTAFRKLNDGWNADPNVPEPSIKLLEGNLLLTFAPNYFRYDEYENVAALTLVFHNCVQYRIGPTNDEGWYRGQCRFSKIAPEWGEFYEVSGDLLLSDLDQCWTPASLVTPDNINHYLFYFRDDTFECDAESWSKNIVT